MADNQKNGMVQHPVVLDNCDSVNTMQDTTVVTGTTRCKHAISTSTLLNTLFTNQLIKLKREGIDCLGCHYITVYMM